MLCCISLLYRHRIQQATNELANKTTSLLKEMSSLCGGSTPTAVSSVKYKALQFTGIVAMLHVSLGCRVYFVEGWQRQLQTLS